MPDTPATIFFDVNETLSDLSPVADAFAAVGAPREAASSWFASILRDGFGSRRSAAKHAFWTSRRRMRATV